MTPNEASDAGANATSPRRLHEGMGVKSRLLNPIDMFWDLRMGVRTFGYKPAVGQADASDFRVHFTPTPYRKLFKILRRIEIDSQDSLLDLGCGLGRAVFAASWLGARRAVGVEIDAELAAAAQATFQNSHLKNRNIELVCIPAESFSARDATVIYMYHPFGPGTMQKVVQTLEQELEARPRRLRIAYENPVHASIIDATRSLRRLDEWPAQKSAGSRHAVVFWEAASW